MRNNKLSSWLKIIINNNNNIKICCKKMNYICEKKLIINIYEKEKSDFYFEITKY